MYRNYDYAQIYAQFYARLVCATLTPFSPHLSPPPSKHTLYSLLLFSPFQTQVFLQHLPSLSQLQNFPELWLGILDFMDKFLLLDNSDLLVSLQ